MHTVAAWVTYGDSLGVDRMLGAPHQRIEERALREVRCHLLRRAVAAGHEHELGIPVVRVPEQAPATRISVGPHPGHRLAHLVRRDLHRLQP